MKPMDVLKFAAAAVFGFTALAPLAPPAQAAEETKYIALTFDDGPNTTTTVEILDILEEYDALATFFLIGNNINDESAASVKRAYDMGCEIGNHSRSHGNMPQLSAEEIAAEIGYVDDYVYEITGEGTRYFRPPFIDTNQTMYDTIDKTFICGFDCQDYMANVTAQQRADAVIGAAKDGLIVLLHDAAGNDQTVEALRTIIPTLQAEGYEFVTLSQLFELQGEAPRHGILYNEVTKYPCDDYILYETLFEGEITGESSSASWSEQAALNTAILASVDPDYAISVACTGAYPPAIALQKWSDGMSVWAMVKPAYFNGERACFLASDIRAALEENGVTYESLDRMTITPQNGTMTLTNISVLVPFTISSVQGDVNADGSFTVLDLVAMQKYLLGCTALADPAAGDLQADGVLDIYDLGMMKKLLLAQ